MSLVGKVQWTLSAAPYCKPLLQPWWSWMKAVESTGCPPHLVSWGASMLIQALNRPTCLASPYQQPIELMAASDASADPESKNSSGGGMVLLWIIPGPTPGTLFFRSLSKDKYQWAFKDGNPQKRIAALGLSGDLLLLLLALQQSQDRNC